MRECICNFLYFLINLLCFQYFSKVSHKGYPKERSFSSWSVLEVIGSHWPQYFKFVMLKETKETVTNEENSRFTLLYRSRANTEWLINNLIGTDRSDHCYYSHFPYKDTQHHRLVIQPQNL